MSGAFVALPGPSTVGAPSVALGANRSSTRGSFAPGALQLGAMSCAGLVALRRMAKGSRWASRTLPRRALGSSIRSYQGPAPSTVTRSAAVQVRTAPPEELLGIQPDEKYNVPVGVREKLGKNLLLNEKHPLGILWKTVQEYFAEQDPNCKFFDTEKPVVSTVECFDKLRVPPDHVSRSPSDTYYVNADYVLRTHTSAHQCQFLSQYPEITSFLCAGDVYRRDEIDASHYPAFHQCEGVRLFDAQKVSKEEVMEDLKKTLEGLAAHLFNLKTGEDTMRWLDEYFPFTEPSVELEIFYNDDWMEVLGCGVIHHDVLRNAGLDPEKVHGWAFGLGLERLAMVLFGIPDIRLFWSDDDRFAKQFTPKSFAEKTKFKPFSKYPPVFKDISMWIPENFVDNDLFEMIRDEGGDEVEKVDLTDEFTHPKTGRSSKTFRVTWRDMSRTLTNEEVNEKHEKVLERVVDELKVELR
mmetsp:Transcript_94946/g.116269  ORF Transcript_94946/g.116269 Transcript_94946/m.116269 type:complete len:467 (+) Transcript_94946:76-1476(+)